MRAPGNTAEATVEETTLMGLFEVMKESGVCFVLMTCMSVVEYQTSLLDVVLHLAAGILCKPVAHECCLLINVSSLQGFSWKKAKPRCPWLFCFFFS